MIYFKAREILDHLPKRIRNKFTTRVSSSRIPGYAPGAMLDTLLWLIPKNSDSAIIVYECYMDLTFEEDPRAWLVDPTSGEWFHIRWPVNLGLFELEITLTRMLREELVVYEILKPMRRIKQMSKIFGPGAAEKPFRLPFFEMSRPNPQWESREIRRFKRWGVCPAFIDSDYQTDESYRGISDFSGDVILNAFIHDLEVATKAKFSWRFTDGGAGEGEIEIFPNNPHSRSLRILVCGGIPCDLLTGGANDFCEMLGDATGADQSTTLGKFPPLVRTVFNYSVKWVRQGVIETIQKDGLTCELSLFDETVQLNKAHTKAKIYPSDPFWREIVAIWEPW